MGRLEDREYPVLERLLLIGATKINVNYNDNSSNNEGDPAGLLLSARGDSEEPEMND